MLLWLELENKNATVEFTVGENKRLIKTKRSSEYLRSEPPYATKDHLYRRLVNAKMRMKS